MTTSSALPRCRTRTAQLACAMAFALVFVLLPSSAIAAPLYAPAGYGGVPLHLSSRSLKDPACGGLVIVEILYNPLKDTAAQEWIKIINIGDETVSLAGWELTTANGASTIPSSSTLTVKPQACVIFGGSQNPSLNNHVLVDWAWSAGLSLGNTKDTVTLFNPSKTMCNTVDYYAAGHGWPAVVSHASLVLTDKYLDNNNGSYWMYATTTWPESNGVKGEPNFCPYDRATSSATPSVTPSSATPSSATPSVTPSSATPSSATPSSDTPSVTPSSATPSSATPSSDTPSVTPSSATPSSATPSSDTPSVTPSSATPSSATPSVTPSSATPSSATPSSATPSVTPSSATPSSATPSVTPSSATPSSATPSSATPSSATPSVTPSSATPKPPASDESSLPLPAIIGGAVAAGILAIIATVLTVIMVRRRRRVVRYQRVPNTAVPVRFNFKDFDVPLLQL